MFIKWRTYQRQKYNLKGDKYYLQPILVQSVRIGKKRWSEYGCDQGMSKEDFKARWQKDKAVLCRSRHVQLHRFPGFPSCAYVHYDEPQWIEQRLHYHEMLDIVLEHNQALSDLDASTKAMIKDEIDSILPEPDDRLLEILKAAYAAGMPKGQSPKEHYFT